jgi:hypothetical protein
MGVGDKRFFKNDLAVVFIGPTHGAFLIVVDLHNDIYTFICIYTKMTMMMVLELRQLKVWIKRDRG